MLSMGEHMDPVIHQSIKDHGEIYGLFGTIACLDSKYAYTVNPHGTMFYSTVMEMMQLAATNGMPLKQ